MKVLWTSNQLSFAAIGGFIGWFLGGCDGLLYALLAFVVIDYITGVMCAIENHDLSSEIGFHGICHKVLIFLLVGIANIVDMQLIGNGSVLNVKHKGDFYESIMEHESDIFRSNRRFYRLVLGRSRRVVLRTYHVCSG